MKSIAPGVAGRVLWAGMAAGAVVACAPIASAQDPPPAQCPQQDPQSDGQQQCPQQPGMPDLPKLPDNSNNAAPQNPAPDKPIDLADKNCWVVNGVPTMWSPAMVTGPGQQAWPCYYVYHLTPH